MKETKKHQKHLKQDNTNPKVDTNHIAGDKRLTKKISFDELLGNDPLQKALDCYA